MVVLTEFVPSAGFFEVINCGKERNSCHW